MTMKTCVKAGANPRVLTGNHNQRGLRVKTGIKAGLQRYKK